MWFPQEFAALDIETDTTEYPGIKYQPCAGLDQRHCEITSIAVSTLDGDEVFTGPGEYQILRDLEDWFWDNKQVGLLLTWNGSVFDLPYIDDRAARHEIMMGLQLEENPLLVPKYEPLVGHKGGYTAHWITQRKLPVPHLDLSFRFKEFAARNGIKHSLKPVCEAHGIEMIKLDASRLSEYSEEERKAYNCSDTRGTLQLGIRALLPDFTDTIAA